MSHLSINVNQGHHESGYPASSSSMEREKTMIVLEKFEVNIEFLSMVQSELEDVWPLLREDTVYCAEDLIGAELWADLTSPAKREAHICLQHLAEQPGAKLSYSRRYGCDDGGFQITPNHGSTQGCGCQH